MAVYVLHGEDTFSSNEAFESLLSNMGSPELRQSNFAEFDAGNVDPALFAATAQAIPFLAERRIILVRGLLNKPGEQKSGRRRSRKAIQDLNSDPWAKIIATFSELPPTTDVIFVENRLSKDNVMLKVLEEYAVVQEFPALRGDQLGNWISKRIKQKGNSISKAALLLMMEIIGSNLWAMESELEKLSIYCGADEVTEEDVRTLISSSREATIFALVDAILEKRTGKAMGFMDDLTNHGATASYILTMVARQVRLLVLAQELVRNKVSQNEWGSRLGINQDFVLKKITQQARQYSSAQLRDLYHLMLETDLAIKLGDVSQEIAMVQFLAQASYIGSNSR